MNSLRLAFRMLLRDFRAGELHLLAFALMLAVASLTSVGFFTDRISQSLEREANQLLGADLRLSADHPWDGKYLEQAREFGLHTVTTTTFTSMASTGEVAQLSGVKAVEPGYPLRGEVKIAPALNQPDAVAPSVPERGSVWLDERLTSALQVKTGDMVSLGELRFRVAGVVTYESDRGANFFAFVPRLMMNAADLPATKLIQNGSRVRYVLQFAGEPAQVDAFRRWAEPQLARGEALEDIKNARPEVRNGLERAQKFLRLAALLAVVLAAVAIGLAARRFMQRHLDGCAVMRCMGSTQADVLRLYVGEFAMLGLAASLAGCVLGYLVQFGLERVLAGLLDARLPQPSLLPVVHGLVVGLVLLAGFVAPQLLRLGRVPTIRVLRREWEGAEGSTALATLAGIASLALLMFWIAGELRLGSAVVGGFAAAIGVFALAARLVLAAAGHVRARSGAGWRYGLASLRRRLGSSLVQAVGLAIGLTALLLLTLTRNDVLADWRRALPPDAPNRFIVNIQPDQVQPLEQLFAQSDLPVPKILPMIRARFVELNGAPIGPERYQDERAKNLAEREFNLSYSAQLQEGNAIVEGKWFGDSATPQFSVEQGLAETLGLKLGDSMGFTVAGTPLTGKITSIRKLEWDSMRVNFFVVAPPAPLKDYPASFVTSFHLPEARMDFTNKVVAEFPNLTVVDMGAIVRQVRDVTDKLALAVQVVFLFALAAGVVVMFAALEATHDEREYELAILRTLGARNRQLRAALLTEFAALGVVAGVLAGIAASAIGWALAHYVFKFPYVPSPWPVVIAVVVGALGVTLAGWLGTRGILRRPALTSLRALA